MCQYHSDTRCGLCDGPLEVDRDAICHKCCTPDEQYELLFGPFDQGDAIQEDEGNAMIDEFTRRMLVAGNLLIAQLNNDEDWPEPVQNMVERAAYWTRCLEEAIRDEFYRSEEPDAPPPQLPNMRSLNE